MISRLEAVRLVSNPLNKLCDLKIGSQLLHRVELTLQGFLREHRMNVVMARTTEPCEQVFYLVTLKVSFDSLVPMAGLWNEMMLGQQADLSPTQFADTTGAHSRFVLSLSRRM